MKFIVAPEPEKTSFCVICKEQCSYQCSDKCFDRTCIGFTY